MALETEAKQAINRLPMFVVGPADISRLIRELEIINSTLLDQKLRKSDGGTNILKTSQLLGQTAEINTLDLQHAEDREQLAQFLQKIKTQAPVLHMSFSADPSSKFLSKLMAWLRAEIHPYALLTIGLQPTIGAGCILRTTNKYFDFSLREDFTKKRLMLLDQLIPETKGQSHE